MSPPQRAPRPDVPTAGKVSFVAEHHLTIQIGFVVLLILLGGAAITNGLVAYQMKRMSVGSVFAYGYIGGQNPGNASIATTSTTPTAGPVHKLTHWALMLPALGRSCTSWRICTEPLRDDSSQQADGR
jgi:hypothetical protein